MIAPMDTHTRSRLAGLLALLAACSPANAPPEQRSPGAQSIVTPHPTMAAAPTTASGAATGESSAEPAKTKPRSKPPMLPAWKGPSLPDSHAACKAILAAQDTASRRDKKPPAGAIAASKHAMPCLPAGKGAWGLISTIVDFDRNRLNTVLDPSCGGPDGNPCLYDAILSLTPVHVSDKGVKVTGMAFTAGRAGLTSNDSDQAGAYDLDGDGEEELLVALGGAGQALTFRDGKVSVYAASKDIAFEGLVDADGDGRPDLLLVNLYHDGQDFLSCGKMRGNPVVGFAVDMPLVARSQLGGAFSLDDAESLAVARKSCPVKPEPIVVKDEHGQFDNGWIRENVVCARLWGVPAQTVIEALERDCRWPTKGGECDALFDARDNATTALCAGHDKLVEWARKVPPVTLH